MYREEEGRDEAFWRRKARKKSAPPGAINDHVGKFDTEDKGAFFLDKARKASHKGAALMGPP